MKASDRLTDFLVAIRAALWRVVSRRDLRALPDGSRIAREVVASDGKCLDCGAELDLSRPGPDGTSHRCPQQLKGAPVQTEEQPAEALMPTRGALARVAADALDVQEIKDFVDKVADIHRAILKPGIHYGKIPGCKKASLWQPGAEVLLLGLRLRPECSVVDQSTSDEIKYLATCRLVHMTTGVVVAESCASCSSNESRYAWREAVCKKEWDSTFETRKRIKYKHNGENSHQVRTVAADVGNTICRMAQKRALVGTAKTATAASNIYASDLEELKESGVDLGNDGTTEERSPIQQPRAAGRPASDDGAIDGRDLAASIVGEAWREIQEVANQTHGKTATQPDIRRLFGIAGQNGWTPTQVKAVVKSALGCDIDNLPANPVYEKVCKAFGSFPPQ
jgi:hypothetical protein